MASSVASAQEVPAAGIDRRLVWIMAVATGIIVGNLYYLQPVLALVTAAFNVTERAVGTVATLSQLGYAAGLLLVVPLGDSRDRRGLIVGTLLASAVSLVALALSPNLVWLAVASLAVGAFTVGAQIIVPFAATLAAPSERGRVVGFVMSGLLIGILLARTVSGVVAAVFGWQAIYWIAAAMMLVLAAVLRWQLPRSTPTAKLSYTALLRSLWGLLRNQPDLREACLLGGLAFAAFSVFWVALPFFLETPPYNYGSDVAGLFGLVGVLGAVAASFAGRLADRRAPRDTTLVGMSVAVIGYLVMALLGWSLWGLALGVILLDMGVQGAHISNQARIYALLPEARNRLNTVYMTTYFLGGSLGTALGAYAWSVGGWPAVCAVGGGMPLLGLLVVGVRRALRRS